MPRCWTTAEAFLCVKSQGQNRRYLHAHEPAYPLAVPVSLSRARNGSASQDDHALWNEMTGPAFELPTL